MSGYFQWQTDEMTHENIWIWLRKENLEREKEYVIIVAETNGIKVNNIKAKINNP